MAMAASSKSSNDNEEDGNTTFDDNEEDDDTTSEDREEEELRWYSNPWICYLHVLFINTAVRCSGGHIIYNSNLNDKYIHSLLNLHSLRTKYLIFEYGQRI